MYSDEEGESLQELDFEPEDIEQIDTTDEAQVIGDQYLPIMTAGYMYEPEGYQATQEYLNKFYDGLTIDRDLSSRENVVIKNDNNSDVYISVPGTTGTGDAVKTWGDIMSEGQQNLLNLTTGFTGQLLGRTGLMGARQFTDRKTYDERVDTTEDTLDSIAQKYGDTDTLLLGHSLGGAITRKVALNNNLSSIIYNSAVGKNSIYQDNQRKNIELRINKDIVSMTMQDKPREFSFDKGYSMFGTIQAHDLTNFILNKDRYDNIMSGKLTLQKHHPLDYSKLVTTPPKKYKNPDAFMDFYERKCPRGFRYNSDKKACEKY
jgi:hypothetical protein